MNRREFLVTGAAAAAAALRGTGAAAQDGGAGAAAPVTLTLHPERMGAVVPESFIGLSYETQQLSDPSFFSAKNTGLVAMFRALTPRGVLRLGGNTSDVGWWRPKANSKRPDAKVWRPEVAAGTVPNKDAKDLSYFITPESVKNLRGFLEATGWTCLYGINLGTNTPAWAAEEATFVAKTLGKRLEYFQLGNEPDQFGRKYRDPKTWGPDAYLDDWLAEANAIRARVAKDLKTEAKFGLPDTAGSPAWSSRIAERLGVMSDKDKPKVGAVSHHYYFGGPPSNPQVNVERMLRTNPGVARTAETTRAAAEKLGTLYRMTEGNTCYQGGKPGVSDVFAASLWAADYLLQLMSLGYAGANLHGGGGKEVANSLGGTLPGEALMTDPKAPHPRPFYTPIAYVDGKHVAEPVYYGMLFAQRFAGSTMVPVEFDAGAVNATAYAGKVDGSLQVVILNKDAERDLKVRLNSFTDLYSMVLSAPSLMSKDVMLDGRKVTEESALAAWKASRKKPMLIDSNNASSFTGGVGVVPRASALWMSVVLKK